MSPPQPAVAPAADLKYGRALLKLSGEALAGEAGFGIDPGVVERLAADIGRLRDLGVGLGIVIGGGNIVRGVQASARGMDRVSADQMGMLATVINALAVQDALEQHGVDTRVMTAIRMEQVAEPYIRRRAIRHLEKGRVVIFAGGTGNPYFSTDSAAVLRGLEIGAQVIVKATKVDGVYTSDPEKDDSAEFIPEISLSEVIQRNLRVMDTAAISLCRDNDVPIIVLNLNEEGSVGRALRGETVGTLVHP